MEWYLISLGILCLGAGFIMEHPVFKAKITNPWVAKQWIQEENRVKQARQQVEKAREDVAVLLEELDHASEKVVELMTSWAQKAQEEPYTQQQVQAEEVIVSKQAIPNVVATPIKPRKKASSPNNDKSKEEAKDKYQTVFNLAERGLSIDDIAQIAKIGKGEVQLLLELKNRGE